MTKPKQRGRISLSNQSMLWAWKVALRMASGILPKGEIDAEGRDTEDYASILMLRAWAAIWRYRTQHWTEHVQLSAS